MALALAMGRCMEEIHSTGKFAPVEGNDYAAMFSGQLKTKADKVYEIPLLSPFEYVARGIEYLESQDKRFEDPNEVNAKVSMQLSNAVNHYKSLNLIQNRKNKS
ncbi:MAG: telomere resolvase [Nodosilinea sp. WJT8-NPBG4]|jgi:hypothetical protein|nr:telomere resolvase [Nodosilinea sp. WJT8-NPBG4]